MSKNLGSRVVIELAKVEDWSVIEEIAVLTAENSNMSSKEKAYFSEFWIGPYRVYAPEFTLVTRDVNNRVVGYLTGHPNTQVLEKKKKNGFYEHLIKTAQKGVYGTEKENKWLKRHLTALKEGAELEGIRNVFSKNVWTLLETEYPAHLHMNLHPDHQRIGLGSLLIKEFIRLLRTYEIKGVHVGCSDYSLNFYLKNGFKVLYQEQGFKQEGFVYILALKL